MKWNVGKGLGVIGLRCPNHSLGGIALWRRAVGFTALPWRGDERPPDAGSRSVARRENGARLASGACSRRGCFCSFALAVLAVLATLAPEPAAAQTVTTFLSNTGQSANTSTNTVRATAFTTGTGTYTLSSVAIYSPIQSTSPTPVVQIYRDSSGNPGTLVATMTNPATVADNTLNVFTAPANTTLAASTTYWVVTSNSVNNFGTDFRVSTNNNNNVDSGTAAGWTIGNGLFKTDVRLAPWTNSSNRHRFQIRGTAQTTTTNSAPTVANVIPDQTATAGTAFSYQFPTNTFNDTDTGDTLSYAATKADDTALPTWLAFTDSTRTFAGTPAVADTGTVSVKVTASDGNGGSISDEFDITVRDPGICARTEAVRDALLAKITGVTDCALVTATHLAAITDTLDLSEKSITALAAGDFDGLTALTYLDLESNELTALPAGVFDELTALVQLWLYNNSLTALPAGVFDGLTALTTLVLESNSLTALPAGVFDELTALEGLGLGSNSLTALPDDVFDELTALTALVLEGNSLTALPAGVFDELTALTFLDLGDNSLTALPAGVFDELTALTILYLASNSLTALPDDVFDKLTALTILGLGGNSLLTALPAGVFDELTALDALFLTGNPLTALPAGVFDKLTALTELYLNNNSLAELPDDVFQELTALVSLVLSGNPGAPFSPTAVALPDDGTVPAAGGTVMLDGSGSGGAWGTNVTYSWALTTPTSGVTVTFDSVSIAEPTVTIPPVTAGTDLVFTLTVTGRGGSNGISTATDTAAVTTTTNSRPDGAERDPGPDGDGRHGVQLPIPDEHVQRHGHRRHPELRGDESRRHGAAHVAGLHRQHAHLRGDAGGRGHRDGVGEGDRERRQRRVDQRRIRHRGARGHHDAHRGRITCVQSRPDPAFGEPPAEQLGRCPGFRNRRQRLYAGQRRSQTQQAICRDFHRRSQCEVDGRNQDRDQRDAHRATRNAHRRGRPGHQHHGGELHFYGAVWHHTECVDPVFSRGGTCRNQGAVDDDGFNRRGRPAGVGRGLEYRRRTVAAQREQHGQFYR